ncbi:MAG: DUF433 domain-containing protein [Chloroflexi bacterium]|nr:DUF433 domain-containing protein [Chloroflexota bacterium]
MPFELIRVEREVQAGLKQLRERTSEQIGSIDRNRYIADNQYTLAGTRIPTKAIWEYHEDGYPVDEILRQYPHLTAEDVRAAASFEQRRRQKTG